MATLAELKKIKWEQQGDWSTDLRIRVHRAVSWLESAEKHRDDDDICLLSLMISLHACYLRKTDYQKNAGAWDTWKEWLECISYTREFKALGDIVYSKTGSQFFREVIVNPYLLPTTFSKGEEEGEAHAKHIGERMARWIHMRDTKAIINQMLMGLNTLRNQISHGSRTYDSDMNADTIASAKDTLLKMQPLFIYAMCQPPWMNWGELAIPVLNEPAHYAY